MYTRFVRNNFLASDKIYVGNSKITGAGRGVFAKQRLKKGDLVERCPIIEISSDDPFITSSTLLNYVFFFGNKKKRCLFALGFGSIYNHSESPDIKFKINSKVKIIEFTAIKNIAKDEELTFNYRGVKTKNRKKPLWFEA